jgi:hypothetical protein
MTQVAPATSDEFTVPEPAEPNYAPSPTLEEQLRQASAAALTGAGTLLDDGWNRWHWLVTPGRPGLLTVQLQVADHITWWKKIELKASFFGQNFSIARPLVTQDNNKVAAIDLRAEEIAPADVLTLEFSKAGVVNTYSYLFSQQLHVPAHVGQRIIYMCTRDNPSQP